MTKTHMFPVHCAWCGKANDRVFAPGQQGPDVAPEDDAAVMCIGCGSISIIDTKQKFNARIPTEEEAEVLAADPFVKRMHWTWRQVMKTQGNA